MNTVQAKNLTRNTPKSARPAARELDAAELASLTGGNHVPTEQISLNYTKIEFQYSRSPRSA